MDEASFDWTLQTVVPAVALALAGAALPLLLVRRHGPSLKALAADLVISAILLVLLGGGLFAALYADQGVDLARRPVGAAIHLLGLGVSASLVWLPVLLLTGLALGQRTEAQLSKLREAREARR